MTTVEVALLFMMLGLVAWQPWVKETKGKSDGWVVFSIIGIAVYLAALVYLNLAFFGVIKS